MNPSRHHVFKFVNIRPAWKLDEEQERLDVIRLDRRHAGASSLFDQLESQKRQDPGRSALRKIAARYVRSSEFMSGLRGADPAGRNPQSAASLNDPWLLNPRVVQDLQPRTTEVVSSLRLSVEQDSVAATPDLGDSPCQICANN